MNGGQFQIKLFSFFGSCIQQYDLSASQFSPDGRVFQIDYAGKAIEQSGTLIGLRGKNGVVLAVEKIVRSPLYEEDAGARIYSIDKHIGIVSWLFFIRLLLLLWLVPSTRV